MKTIIIAEIGVNHNGSLKIAKKLIDEAKKAQVDYVKFQSYITDKLLVPGTKLANYQKKTKIKNQFELLKKYELTFSQQKKIFSYCRKKKVNFLSTPFDKKSLEFIKMLNPKYIKVSSTDLGNIPLLKEISKSKKKILLSTGMSTIEEIKKSLKELYKHKTKKKDITLLHCHSAYPTLSKDVNLNSMIFLKKKFKLNVGFSDHSLGIDAALAAATLGAKVIEKHFTLDKKMRGPDHSSSINSRELRNLVKSVRNIEKILGVEKKFLSRIEKQNRIFTKRSIFAFKSIKKGEKFNENNICTKRPFIGIPSHMWNDVIGKRATKNFEINEKIIL